MWIVDMPNAYIEAAPHIVLAANKGIQAAGSDDPKRVIGVCYVVSGTGAHRQLVVSAEGDADSYMYRYEGKESYFQFDAVTRVVVLPKHGRLVSYDNRVPGQDLFKYYPETNYDGRDSFVLEVEKGGIAIQLRYRLEVVVGGDTYGLCPQELWKISFPTTTLQTIGGVPQISYMNRIFPHLHGASESYFHR